MSVPKSRHLHLAGPDTPRLRIRVVFDEARFLGPGKADLLAGIARTGSIAAAGREMGMSYKRAWDLVGAMNAMFAQPLVISVRGGSTGGGAALTENGAQVLALYEAVQRAATHAGGAALAELAARLAKEQPTDIQPTVT